MLNRPSSECAATFLTLSVYVLTVSSEPELAIPYNSCAVTYNICRSTVSSHGLAAASTDLMGGKSSSKLTFRRQYPSTMSRLNAQNFFFIFLGWTRTCSSNFSTRARGVDSGRVARNTLRRWQNLASSPSRRTHPRPAHLGRHRVPAG